MQVRRHAHPSKYSLFTNPHVPEKLYVNLNLQSKSCCKCIRNAWYLKKCATISFWNISNNPIIYLLVKLWSLVHNLSETSLIHNSKALKGRTVRTTICSCFSCMVSSPINSPVGFVLQLLELLSVPEDAWYIPVSMRERWGIYLWVISLLGWLWVLTKGWLNIESV